MFLAIEAAFCSAERVTIAGSITPAARRSTISLVMASIPAPSWVAHVVDDDRALETGVVREPAKRLFEGSQRDPRALLVLSSGTCRDGGGRSLQQRDAPPGTMPCSSAAGRLQRVLDAVLFSFISVAVAAPVFTPRDTAGELREALLRLLAVEVRVGVRWAIRTAGSGIAHGPAAVFRR